MNYHLKYLFVSLALVVQPSAFAGNTGCQKDLNLVCGLKYLQTGGVVTQGPSASAPISDIEPEPFAPSECEAAVVFQSEVGKLVASYDDNQQFLRAFQDFGPAENMLITNETISTEKSASALIPTDSSGDGVLLSCHLERTTRQQSQVR